MHAIFPSTGDFPDWQRGAEQRLRLSMLVAAALVAVLLNLFRFPSSAGLLPFLELAVEIVSTEALVAPPRDEPRDEPLPAAAEPPAESAAAPPLPAMDSATDEPAGAGRPQVDWDVERERAIREILDAAEREAAYSVNPGFERARQEASVRFRASVAPEERHIWDNVEKDQLGRTILRDGNCFRVLDDPSVTNRWAFENFDRYIVYCDLVLGSSGGRELPWVEIIRERYPYLRDPVPIP